MQSGFDEFLLEDWKKAMLILVFFAVKISILELTVSNLGFIFKVIISQIEA